jgi:hypothetical protein
MAMQENARMPQLRHTWLFEPGIWSAAGRFWEKGESEREGRGTSIVRHTGALWEIEGSMEICGEPPVRFQNNYRIAAPRADARIVPWQSENPALGTLNGVFVVLGDTIMSSFRSGDGGFVGSEAMRHLAPDRYQAQGLLLGSGAVVSAWSMELLREGVGGE